MDRDFKLGIGGLIIAVHAAEELAFLFDRRFLPFIVPSRRSDIAWGFHLLPARSSSTGHRQGRRRPSPRSTGSGGRGGWTAYPQLRSLMEKKHGLRAGRAIERHAFTFSILDSRRKRVDIFHKPGSAEQIRDHGAGPALLAPFLPGFDASLLHASAVVRGNGAAIFLAPDEGGKTTAARLSPSGTILGDDQILVRRVRGRFRVSGTPWGLHADARAYAPLAGLFLLKKAPRFGLAPLSARELVPAVWEEIANPLSILPKPLKKKAFGILCDIAGAVPAWTLSFSRERIDWDAVDRALHCALKGS